MALTDSLISWWELGEASGTRNDSHGTNHLTDNNTVAQAAGKVGNCADFEDGNGEFLSRADNTSLSAGDIDLTVCAWVQLESKISNNVGNIVAKRSAAVQEYYLRYNNESSLDRFQLEVSPNGTTGHTNVIANNFGSPSLATWYFVVAWHDSVNNQLGIQVNNGTANTTAYSNGIFDGTTDFCIGGYTGASPPSEFWDGLIDQVGLWKRILTASEKTFLYNNGSGKTYAQVVIGEAILIKQLTGMRPRMFAPGIAR